MALMRKFTRYALLGATLAGCSSEVPGRTEVFVSVDAIGAARQASSVRIQVDEIVVELPRKEWPLQVLVTPATPTRAAEFELRAFGLRGGKVLGAAEKGGRFKARARTELSVALDPRTDAGALPEVNAHVGQDGIASLSGTPDGPMDGGTDLPPDASPPERDAEQAAPDGGDGPVDASHAQSGDAAPDAGGGTSECDAASCDAGPTCVPSPDDCGSCGNLCPVGQQCIDNQCKITPPSNCSSYENQSVAYLVCTDARSWSAARTACRGFPGRYDLVRIESPDENAFLHTVIAGDMWIGADDRGNNGTNCYKSGDEGTWDWVNPTTGDERGTQFCALASATPTAACTPTNGAYTDWRANQPSNKDCSCGILNLGLTACSDGDDCATISASDGAWAASQCNVGRGYVCEAY